MSHKLTPKQLKAVYILAQGGTIMEISKKLKLRRETLSRWKKQPEFAAEFDSVMNEMRGNLQQRLTLLVGAAIDGACGGLSYGGDPKRVQAALNVLKLLDITRVMLPDASEKEPNAT